MRTMKRLLPIQVILSCCLSFGFAQGIQGNVKLTGKATIVTTGHAVTASFFGLIVHVDKNFPASTFNFGAFRFWDDGTYWTLIQTAPTRFNWQPIDDYLSSLHEANINTTLYTMGPLPPWASSNPTDATCDYAAEGNQGFLGTCDPPVDINADGTGSNEIWRNWVAAMATHVNNSTYLQTHAHIGYWELWNEFYRSNSLQPGYKATPMSWRGTYAELIRMTQDMNCIITGRVQTITTNNNENCAHVLASVGLSAPVDPSATIVSPSGMGTNALGGLTVLQNFLYCNNNPPKSADCTTSSNGADAVDIINVHVYVEHEPIESTWQTNVSNLQTILHAQELGKPRMMGEGSFGDPLDEASNAFKNPQSQVSFIARYSLTAWSLGISNMYWYAYDATLPTPGRGFGVLMVPDGKQGCEQTGGCITPAGTAWQQTYNWMVGATMTTPCSNQGTIWTCGLTRTNPSGYQAEAIWDNSSKYYCTNESCPTHDVGMPTIYSQYRDLAGNTTQIQNNTAPIGSLPILLENQ